MNLIKKILLIIMVLIILLMQTSCGIINFDNKSDNAGLKESISDVQEYDPDKVYTEDEIIDKIIALVSAQEAAMIAADEEAIVETINPVDAWLQLEAKHLAADQKVFPVKDYKKSVTDIKKDGAFYIGTISQSFVFEGKQKQSTEERYFMFENGRAYDMGTALEKAMWGNVFAAFPSGEYDFAKDMSTVLNSYVDSINNLWKTEFDSAISIKIYDDKDTFLYNTKLSMPDWAGGWYESGESIKTYIYDTTQEHYEYLMRHEATHMLLAHATNDNAAYWMQEGFATTMPEYIVSGELAINRQDVLKEAYEQGVLPTVSEHSQTNIETLSEMFDVRVYYGYSSAMVVYLLERMDNSTLIRFFDELKTYPYIQLTMSEKAFDTQEITENCIKKATGQSFESFYSGFDSWLKAKVS